MALDRGLWKHDRIPQLALGAATILSGLIILWVGVGTLSGYWHAVKGYFPLVAPPDLGEKVQQSLPLIVVTFIRVVSSLCAVLIGFTWIWNGIAEMASMRQVPPQEIRYPGIAAESLQSSTRLDWKSYAAPVRFLMQRSGWARSLGPVPYEFILQIVRSSVKILVLGVVVALVFAALRAAPALVGRYTGVTVKFVVPAAAPLYYLISATLGLNAVLLVLQLPLFGAPFERSFRSFRVRGRGSPNLFFALLEESCKLLNRKGAPDMRPVRLGQGESHGPMASLVENYPHPWGTSAHWVGYVCTPIMIALTVIGFIRLMRFSRPLADMPYQIFLSRELGSYLLEAVFAIGLIIMGAYFGSWARRFFDTRKYRSFLVLSDVGDLTGSGLSAGVGWSPFTGVTDRFADWAKRPQGDQEITAHVFWAEAITESVTPEGPRYVSELKRSPELDAAIARILKIPFVVSFSAEALSGAAAVLPESLSSEGAFEKEWSV